MKTQFGMLAKWSLPIFVATVLSVPASATASDTIKFTFAPGGNISFVQRLTTNKETDMGDKGTQLDESISVTNIAIAKTASGWDVLAAPQSISMRRNGQEITSPIVKLLSSSPVTYKLDPEGNILDVDGYEPFIEGISRQVGPEVFKQLEPILNIDAMKAKEIAEWNGRIGDYLGAEAQVGDSFVAEVPYELPNGASITYVVRTTIADSVPCGIHKCVRIEQHYDSNADAIAGQASEVLSGLTKDATPAQEQSDPTSGTATVRGKVSRVVDPTTMLVYEEESSRTIEMEINIPGAGLTPAKTTETRKYEFVY